MTDDEWDRVLAELYGEKPGPRLNALPLVAVILGLWVLLFAAILAAVRWGAM